MHLVRHRSAWGQGRRDQGWSRRVPCFRRYRFEHLSQLTGGAEVLHDVGKAEELWSNEAQAWWPKGPTDPEVRVLRVVPDNAEFWDTRGNSITVALKLVAARATRRPPELGENKK